MYLSTCIILTTIINSNNGIIATVGKHIATQETLARRSKGIRIDESADGGIVVTALEVVEPGFSVVVVATVADGINSSHGAAGINHIAPGIVAILRNSCASAVDNPDDIALLVQHIDVVCTVVLEGIGQTAVIVDDIQDIAAPGLTNDLTIQSQVVVSHTVNSLAVTDASHVVGVLDLVVIGLCTDELAALFPVKVPTGAVVVAV